MKEVLKEMFVEIHVGRNENLNVLTGGEAVMHVEVLRLSSSSLQQQDSFIKSIGCSPGI